MYNAFIIHTYKYEVDPYVNKITKEVIYAYQL